MNKEYDRFSRICALSQQGLKSRLTDILNQVYEKTNVENDDGYLYARGEFPVLLVAHLDTVHKELPKRIINKGGILSSPYGIGGDDRCGVYMVLEIIKKYKCSVVFCEDEEIGGIGAKKFAQAHPELTFNYIIEFDRMGKTDAVFYDCDNPDFTKFITDGGFYKEEFGSFSDISIIAPAFKCAAVNLSCGYYNPHTVKEYVKFTEMTDSIAAAEAILERTDPEKDKFEYIEVKYNWGGMYGGWYGSTAKSYFPASSSSSLTLWYIITVDHIDDTVWAADEDSAVGKFMKMHPNVCYNDITDIIEDEDDMSY